MDADRDPATDVSSLAREIPPPPDLETRVVAHLRDHGLIGARPNRGTSFIRIAAAVALFVSGVALGRASVPEPRETHAPAGPQYLLLLYGGPTGLTNEQEAAVAREYGEWAVQLRDEGRFVTGERLSDQSVAVPPLDRSDVTNVRGYFIISAASLNEALVVAGACPHARRGGHVIVRPIDPV